MWHQKRWGRPTHETSLNRVHAMGRNPFMQKLNFTWISCSCNDYEAHRKASVDRQNSPRICQKLLYHSIIVLCNWPKKKRTKITSVNFFFNICEPISECPNYGPCQIGRHEAATRKLHVIYHWPEILGANNLKFYLILRAVLYHYCNLDVTWKSICYCSYHSSLHHNRLLDKERPPGLMCSLSVTMVTVGFKSWDLTNLWLRRCFRVL